MRGHLPTLSGRQVARQPLWQQRVIYPVDPRSDADAAGDLRGVTSRLDHLAWLGVDAIWLSIYRSPIKDFGYDSEN